MASPTRIHEEWLALRCQGGDHAAFETLIATFERPLYCYAFHLTRRPEVALEVLQEVWLRAFRGIGKLEKPAALRSWLYTLTHGLAVDRIRSEIARERAEAELAQFTEDTVDPVLPSLGGDQLHQALAELEPRLREVLVLFFLEDFSLEEIAAIVGCPTGTVKSRLHYAKRNLKTILERGGYEPHA